jgi:hypothetical protein
MARITTSALISDISGKVAGSVFQRSQGGLILRTKSGSINRLTPSQINSRIIFAQVAQAWTLLSLSKHNQWNAYATYLNKNQNHSSSLKQSGQAVFMYVNCIRWQLSVFNPTLGTIIISSPSFLAPLAPVAITSITQGFGSIDLVTASSINIANAFWLLKISAPLTRSQNSRYNKMKIIPITCVNGTSQNIQTAYSSVWGRICQSTDYVNTELVYVDKSDNGISLPYRQRLQVL